MVHDRRYFDVAKRALDIGASSIGLVITAPIQIVVGGLVLLKLGRPVLFRQTRPGKDGRVFSLLKFRSMLPVDEDRGWVTNEERMTKFGSFIRATSLDELPSLVNILRGDMSLVGPRPLLVKYLPLYSEDQARRHEVRPGLTGLAQINGRNALDWDRRFRLDVEYVDKRSFKLDFYIIMKTAGKVLRREGVVTDGHSVGAPFVGSLNRRSDEL